MRSFAIVACIVLWSGQALAGTAKATVDRTTIGIDDELELAVTIVGDASSPVLPGSLRDGFDVGGTRQAHTTNIVNGRMSSTTQYSWTLRPRRVGTLEIPEITVKVDGALIATQPISITVQQASAGVDSAAELWASAEIAPLDPDRTSAFVGEQLIYTLKLYARADAECSSLSLPSFANATVAQLGENRQYVTHAGGEELSVIEIRRAVFPTKPGPLEIPAAMFTCAVQHRGGRSQAFGQLFGRTQRKNVRSSAATIVVRALPPAPPEFSGLVGTVNAQARLGTADIRQGESTTLSVTVRGNGDMARAREPALALGDDFKIYPDKPRLDSDDSGAELLASRVFESALVAQRAGDFNVTLSPITYFDPQTQTYARANIPPLTVHVAPDAKAALTQHPAEQPRPTTASTTPGAEPQPAALAPASSVAGNPARAVILWGVVALIVTAMAGGLLVAWRRRSASPRASRRAAARAASAALASVRDSDAPAQTSRIVRELIGVRTGSVGHALTSDEAVQALEAEGAAALATEVRTLLTACDTALYGGSTVAVHGLVARAQGLVNRLAE